MNPGSAQAREKGCVCPSDVNQDGQGTHTITPSTSNFFLIDADCPVHGKNHWGEKSTTT